MQLILKSLEMKTRDKVFRYIGGLPCICSEKHHVVFGNHKLLKGFLIFGHSIEGFQLFVHQLNRYKPRVQSRNISDLLLVGFNP